MRRFLTCNHGSVSVEMALLIPILVFVLWFGAEASYHYRLQNRLHRATATLADILANRVLEDEETLDMRIPGDISATLSMLQTMMGPEEAGKPGMRVTYFATPVPGADAATAPLIWETGQACGDSALGPLDALGVAGALITEDNVAKAELVRVEACFLLTERWNVTRVVFPTEYSSHFVTLRKEW